MKREEKVAIVRILTNWIKADSSRKDDMNLYNKNRRDTCSHHGGVAKWL